MISVVICTRNRAESLRRTLERLAAMAVPRDCTWELIVVDNGSQDDTRTVVEDAARTSGLNIRCVFEGTMGLSHARNTGLAEARGDIVAFTDDDMLVDAAWLSAIFQEFAADPELAILGGRTLPASATTPRLAMKTQITRQHYAFPSDPRQVCKGNNMALRASVVAEVGFFDIGLGAGSPAGSGEETDYVYRILRAGRKAVYSPLPVAYHDPRRTPEDLQAVRLAYTRGWGALLCKHMLRGDAWMAKVFVSEVKRLAGAVLRGRGDRMNRRRLQEFFKGVMLRVFSAASGTGGGSTGCSTSARTSRDSPRTSAGTPVR